MSEIEVVSRERHAGLTWRRPSDYFFAANDPVATLVSQEAPRAMMSAALGFIGNGESHLLVAVQGLKPGQNKFVGRDGRWLGDYVPAIYRAQPFRLARNQDGVEVLCIDETAGHVSGSSNGEPFFASDGTPTSAVADAFKLLVELEKDRQRTQKACTVLEQHGLLEPWALKAQDGDEVLEAKGLLRIVEGKLYALQPEALAEVRNSGGLMLAFAQLFSMQHLHKLGKLGAPAPGSAPAQPSPKLFEENGLISFANL